MASFFFLSQAFGWEQALACGAARNTWQVLGATCYLLCRSAAGSRKWMEYGTRQRFTIILFTIFCTLLARGSSGGSSCWRKVVAAWWLQCSCGGLHVRCHCT